MLYFLGGFVTGVIVIYLLMIAYSDRVVKSLWKDFAAKIKTERNKIDDDNADWWKPDEDDDYWDEGIN